MYMQFIGHAANILPADGDLREIKSCRFQDYIAPLPLPGRYQRIFQAVNLILNLIHVSCTVQAYGRYLTALHKA